MAGTPEHKVVLPEQRKVHRIPTTMTTRS
jgi:hypothetical protein